MLIWNQVQQDSGNATFFPTNVNAAFEQSTKAAQFSLRRVASESSPSDDFAELLPSGD